MSRSKRTSYDATATVDPDNTSAVVEPATNGESVKHRRPMARYLVIATNALTGKRGVVCDAVNVHKLRKWMAQVNAVAQGVYTDPLIIRGRDVTAELSGQMGGQTNDAAV